MYVALYAVEGARLASTDPVLHVSSGMQKCLHPNERVQSMCAMDSLHVAAQRDMKCLKQFLHIQLGDAPHAKLLLQSPCSRTLSRSIQLDPNAPSLGMRSIRRM